MQENSFTTGHTTNRLNTKMESDKSTQAHRHATEFMRPLVKKLSKHALDKLLEQEARSPCRVEEQEGQPKGEVTI